MLLRSTPSILLTLIALAPLAAHGADWTNSGGNSRRNGQSSEAGPQAPDVLWSGGEPSIIGWLPIIVDSRLFTVRQSSFVMGGVSSEAPIVALDLDTGDELWRVDIPAEPGDWTTWIAGASNGRLYASRSGNGDSVAAVIHALDQTNGEIVWTSDEMIRATPYDGVVFTPTGDLVVGEFTKIRRISAADGSFMWETDRLCQVSSSCGVALHENSVYSIDSLVPETGQALERFDLDTGEFLYAGPKMEGTFIQNTPMIAPDGTIYVSRTDNGVINDKIYAFTDTGEGFELKWSVPMGWTTNSEFAVAPNGDVFTMTPARTIARLDPETGATLFESEPITSDPDESLSVSMAVDRDGVLFVANGAYGENCRLFAFGCDMSTLWSLPVINVSSGGPVLGSNGTLVITAEETDMRAFRSAADADSMCPDNGPGSTGDGSDTAADGTDDDGNDTGSNDTMAGTDTLDEGGNATGAGSLTGDGPATGAPQDDDSSSGGAGEADGTGGCGCTSGHPAAPAWLTIVVAALGRRRRARR